jgi:hypothetical protein
METRRKHIPTWLYKLGGRLDKQYAEIVSALSDINAFNAGKKRDKALELIAAWLPDMEKFSKEIGKQQAYIDSLKERIGQESDYAGRMRDEKYSVMCKTEAIFKVGKYKKLPEEEWIRTDNTHEPLVSQEVFDGANAKILSRKRDTTNNFVSVFSGLVKCGTCGKALALRYWGRDRHRIYVCTTYAHNTKACTDHRIYYEDLYNAVLSDIQHHARLAFEDREKAVALAVKMNAKVEGNRGKNNETKLKQARKRYDEVTRLFDRLYEDSLAGRISNDNFTRLIDKYQTEQGKLLEQIATLEDTLQEVKDSQNNAVQWAELMAGYVGITELTAENLNLLVERIEVSDRTETEDGMQQTVKICYRFGGYIGEQTVKTKMIRKPRKKRDCPRKTGMAK